METGKNKRVGYMVLIVRGDSMEGRECFRNPLKSETVWISEREKGEFEPSGEKIFNFGDILESWSANHLFNISILTEELDYFEWEMKNRSLCLLTAGSTDGHTLGFGSHPSVCSVNTTELVYTKIILSYISKMRYTSRIWRR